MPRAAALLAVALFVVPVEAVEPLAFKGLAPGASQEQFQALMPGIECSGDTCTMLLQRQCREHRDFDALRACQQEFTYGGHIIFRLTGTFEDGALIAVTAIIENRRFRDLVAALRERYGEPGSDTVEHVQNKLGARFENRILVWPRGDTALVVQQRAGRLDEAAVSLMSAAYRARQKRESEQKAKAAAKQL